MSPPQIIPSSSGETNVITCPVAPARAVRPAEADFHPLPTFEPCRAYHRRHLMQKMQATSFADLLRMAADLKIPYTKV
jgi:hypothetical protein